jgi:hypothetical protein
MTSHRKTASGAPLPWIIALLAVVWGCGQGGDGQTLPLAQPGGAPLDSGWVAGARWPGFPLLPDDRFPISGWCAPPVGETSAERYAEYAEAGFTVVLPALEDPYLESTNLARLRVAWEHGLFTILRDDRVHPDEATRAGWGVRVDSVVAAYSGKPGFLAYFLADEPAPEVYPSLAALNHRFAARDPWHPAYVNLLGLSPAGYGHHGLAYNRYLGDFLDQAAPSFFSIDLYPLATEGDVPNFCPGLDTARVLARNHGIPFWAILLLTPHLSFREPTAAELAWQANLALAYGAKGIVWFTYWTPRPDASHYRMGPISHEGERTAAFERVKMVNRGVQVLGSELAVYEPWAVLHSGSLPRGGAPLAGDFRLGDLSVRIESPGDLTVSVFLQSAGLLREPRDFRLLIVNRDHSEPTSCGVTVPGWQLCRLDEDRDTWSPPTGGRHVTTLPPGGAALYSVVP